MTLLTFHLHTSMKAIYIVSVNSDAYNIYMYKRNNKILYFTDQFNSIYVMDVVTLETKKEYSLSKVVIFNSNNYVNNFGYVEQVNIE